MKVDLVGFREGIAKKTGKPYAFLYCSHKGQDVVGVVVFQQYVGEGMSLPPLSVGMKLDLSYDKDGYLTSIEDLK